MKSAINIICFLLVVFGTFFAGFGSAWLYKQTLLDEQIRSVQETQEQLINAGYGKVWIKGEWKIVKVDGVWGEITDAAYCAYMADKTIARMENKQ